MLPQPEAGGHRLPDAPQERGTRRQPRPLPGAWTTLGPEAQGGCLSRAHFVAELTEVGGKHPIPARGRGSPDNPFLLRYNFWLGWAFLILQRKIQPQFFLDTARGFASCHGETP